MAVYSLLNKENYEETVPYVLLLYQMHVYLVLLNVIVALNVDHLSMNVDCTMEFTNIN